MYCFAKFCCMCLCVAKYNQNFVSINTIGKDNMCLFDKIAYCLPAELQDILKYEIQDAKICTNCRDYLRRTYNFLQRANDSLNIIKGYAKVLSESNNKNTVSMLQVSLNSPPKKKKKIQELSNYTETNKETDLFPPSPTKNISPENPDEIYELRLPLPDIIENSFNNSEETADCIDIKPIIDINSLLSIYSNSKDIIKEEPEDMEMKSEYSIKTELHDFDNEEFFMQVDELSIKEEFCIPECNRSSPCDTKSIFNSFIEEATVSTETLQLSEPVQNETILQEPSNAVKEVANTSQEEKRKKPTPLPCPLCKTSFYSANAMARHLSKQHNKSRFNCTVCNLSFKSEMVLKRHILIHSGQLYKACKI